MKPWHIGRAVPDLDKAQREVGTLWNLKWRPVVTRSLSLVELWESIPGTPLETPESGWLHHAGKSVLPQPSGSAR